MNKILSRLIFADVFLSTGFGLVNPIFAIFIKDNLAGGTIAAAGIATAIFLIIKSFLQIVISKKFNPKDRVWLLLTGVLFVSFVPFFYAFSTNIWHIYLAQIFHAVGAAMFAPTFMGLFILHINRKKPGLQWSIYSTSVSLGTGLAALIGAGLASVVGFKAVFFVNGVMALFGALVLFKLHHKHKKHIDKHLRGLE